MDIAEALKYVIRDPERKPLARIAIEAAHCALREREVPIHYFTALLHQKGSADYRQFVGHKYIHRITRDFYHALDDYSDLEDKIRFAEILTQHGVPTPPTRAHSDGMVIDVEGTPETVHSKSELDAVVRRILDRSRDGRVFVKPVDGIGGKHSFKLGPSVTGADVDRIYDLLPTTRLIFQEYVTQHEDIDRIYARSINTLRVHSYRDPDTREVEIISAFMRFGAGGLEVDNASSGGFYIPVDLDAWTLRGQGKSLLQSGGHTFVEHPDTGVPLDGFRLPFKSDTRAMVESASLLFQKDFVGWDVALTEQGPMLIEGNQNPHLIMAQVACGGLRSSPGFVRVFKDYI